MEIEIQIRIRAKTKVVMVIIECKQVLRKEVIKMKEDVFDAGIRATYHQIVRIEIRFQVGNGIERLVSNTTEISVRTM